MYQLLVARVERSATMFDHLRALDEFQRSLDIFPHQQHCDPVAVMAHSARIQPKDNIFFTRHLDKRLPSGAISTGRAVGEAKAVGGASVIF